MGHPVCGLHRDSSLFGQRMPLYITVVSNPDSSPKNADPETWKPCHTVSYVSCHESRNLRGILLDEIYGNFVYNIKQEPWYWTWHSRFDVSRVYAVICTLRERQAGRVHLSPPASDKYRVGLVLVQTVD